MTRQAAVRMMVMRVAATGLLRLVAPGMVLISAMQICIYNSCADEVRWYGLRRQSQLTWKRESGLARRAAAVWRRDEPKQEKSLRP